MSSEYFRAFLLWHLNFKFGKGATVFLGDFFTCRALNCFLLWLGVSCGNQWAETVEHDAVMKCGLLECHTCRSWCAWAWQQSSWTFWTDVLQRCKANWSRLFFVICQLIAMQLWWMKAQHIMVLSEWNLHDFSRIGALWLHRQTSWPCWLSHEIEYDLQRAA